jgi:hypothetical protein
MSTKRQRSQIWIGYDCMRQNLVLLRLLGSDQYHLLTSMSYSGGAQCTRGEGWGFKEAYGLLEEIVKASGRQEQIIERAAGGRKQLNRKARAVCNIVTCLTTSWSE